MGKSKNSLVITILKIKLEVALILVFLFGVISIVGFIAGMIAPENETANQFNMGQLYTLTLPDLNDHFQVTSSDSAVFDEQIELCGTVFFKTANRWFLLFFWIFYFACWFLAMMIVLHLLRFLESLRSGSPFIKENAARMKYIGWSIIAFTISRIIMLAGSLYYMHSSVHVTNGKLALPPGEVVESLHLEILFAGFVILVIAQIFDEGVKMKLEQELTI